jgi:predicted PurR-regulated permease PerM
MADDQARVESWRKTGLTVWSLIGIIILVALFLYIFDNIKSILTPFIYALALVYILRPVVNFLESRKIPRVLALILTYLLFIIILTLLLLYFVPIIIEQAGEFAKRLPLYVKTVQDALLDYRGRLNRLHVPPAATNLIEDALTSLKKSGLTFASRLPGATVGLVSGFVSSFLYFVLAPVLAFYILKDLHKIKETIVGLIPPKHRDEALKITHKIDEVVGGFVKGQFLVALSVGFLVYFWLLVIRVDYPLIIGMVTGVLNIIPYFGPIIGGALAFIVGAFKSWKLALLAIAGIFAIQQIDGLLISPNIMSTQVELHPVVIIFSLLIGGYMFGFIGMLLAIPVAAVAKALVYHFLVYEDDHVPASERKPRFKKSSK